MEVASQCLGFEVLGDGNCGREKALLGFLEGLESLQESGVVKGLDLVWGDGVEDVGKTWERLCKGEDGPSESSVFTLNHGFTEKL